MYSIFNSVDKLHIISITICDNIAYFKIINFEFEFVKTFLLLFKECIEYLLFNEEMETIYNNIIILQKSKITSKMKFKIMDMLDIINKCK